MGLQDERARLLAACLLALSLLLAGCATTSPPSPQLPGKGQTVIPVTHPEAPQACNTKECFIAAANNCESKSIVVAEDFGTVNYSTGNCVFTKTIVSLDASEPQDMRNALEGKSLACKYKKGNFDPGLASSLVLGIENCEGELRDALALLVAFSGE